MSEIGKLIRRLRQEHNYPLRKVADFLDIDQAVLSKIERGQRRISKERVLKLADFFNYDKKKMLVTYLSDQIIYEIKDEELAKEALKAAEIQIEYVSTQTADKKAIIDKIKSVLENYDKIQKAWIYGSFARGDDMPLSDIDIAVKTDDNFSYFDLAEIQHLLSEKLNKKIDIGFIDSFKPHIYNNIQKDLALIYER